MKMGRKAAEILELISTTPFLNALQQDSMLSNSTKFNLSVQGWILKLSLKPVLKAWMLIYE